MTSKKDPKAVLVIKNVTMKEIAAIMEALSNERAKNSA